MRDPLVADGMLFDDAVRNVSLALHHAKGARSNRRRPTFAGFVDAMPCVKAQA